MENKRHSQAQSYSSLKSRTKAQMHISFGMIFSIILIIFFIAFAFYGIRMFLGFQDSAVTTSFVGDLRADVERVWRSSQTSQVYSYSLPSRVEAVCFGDFSEDVGKGMNRSIYSELRKTYFAEENLVFYPVKRSDMESVKIEHLDIFEMTSGTDGQNPLCIPVRDGKLQLRLTKGISNSLVKVENV